MMINLINAGVDGVGGAPLDGQLSQKVQGIMEAELGDLGRAIFRNRCMRAGLDPDAITKGDLPKVAQAISEAMFSFSAERAMRVRVEINKLHDLEKIVDRESDPSKQMEGLFNLAEASRLSSDFDSALRYFERLLEMSASDPLYRGRAYWGLGAVRSDMSDTFLALDAFERGLEIAFRVGDEALIAKLYHGIGRSNLRRGSYEDALRYLAKALEKVGGDIGLQCQIRMDVGLVHDGRSDYKAALANIQEAIDLSSKGAEHYDIARMYNNLGEVLKHMGRLEEALEKYSKALEEARKIKNTRLEAYATGNCAEVQARLGKVEASEALARDALDKALGSKDQFAIGATHLILGVVRELQRDLRGMDESFTKAEKIFRMIQSPYDLGTTLLEHGKGCKGFGRKKEARELLREALATFREIGSTKLVRQVEAELEGL
jgi:tetratricopeptide (TPR) repeat protein